jgi:uncharacterized Zn-finger protein
VAGRFAKPAKRLGDFPPMSDPVQTAAQPASSPEVVVVHSRRIACDGVGGALGHPRVYLEMGDEPFVECLYCDRRFVLATPEHDESERLAPGVYEGHGGH